MSSVYSAYSMEVSGESKSEKDTSSLHMHGAASHLTSVTASSGSSVPSVLFVRRYAQQRLMTSETTGFLSGP